MARFFYARPACDIERRIDELLDLVDLASNADRPFRGYTGGERQRLCIVQANVNEPDPLLMNEPAAALYPASRLLAYAPTAELLAGDGATTSEYGMRGPVDTQTAALPGEPWGEGVRWGEGSDPLLYSRVNDVDAAEGRLLRVALDVPGVVVRRFRRRSFGLEVFIEKPTAEDPADLACDGVEAASASTGATLSVTLTLPRGDGPHPGTVLVSGSGAQDRSGMKPPHPGTGHCAGSPTTTLATASRSCESTSASSRWPDRARRTSKNVLT